MRIAPSVPDNNTVKTYKSSDGTLVQVMQPGTNDRLHSSYRIPRRVREIPLKPKIQRLLKKKAAVLSDKVCK